MANQARILLFNMNTDRQHSIERLCRSLSIKTSYINSSSYYQTMGYLAGIQGFARTPSNNISKLPKQANNDFNMEMLVFSGMDSSSIDEFLDAFKKTNLSPVALKAILTPTNIFWTPIQLYKELSKEHQVMAQKNTQS